MKNTSSLHFIMKHQCDRRNRPKRTIFIYGRFGNFRGLDYFFFQIGLFFAAVRITGDKNSGNPAFIPFSTACVFAIDVL